MLRAMILTLTALTLTGAACAQSTASLLGVASEAKATLIESQKVKMASNGKLFFGIEWGRDSARGITTWVAPKLATGFRIKQVEYRWQPLSSDNPGPDAALLKGGVVVKNPARYYGTKIALPGGWRFDEGVQATERDPSGVQLGIAARITIMPIDGSEEEVVRIVVRSPAFRPAAAQAD